MIDGVKLLCNLNPNEWTNNKNLSFRSWTDTATGEIPKNNKHANINGLHLSIIDGEKSTFCNVRGSLPKYYNKGETNAPDYHYTDFVNTCDQLQTQLRLNPETALLRGFEFGANINIPFDIQNVYECVKCYKQYTAKANTDKGKAKGISFDFQQYQIKIYDKGLQETGKKSRVMRFEIVVKKMEWVKNLPIKTLADLQSPAVWLELSKILLKVWNDTIFIDKSLLYKAMTNHEQKKYLYYFNAHYWANLNRKQYNTAKNHLNKLQFVYEGKSNTKQIISTLLADKLPKLSNAPTLQNGYELTALSDLKSTFKNPEYLQHLKNIKWVRFNHLDERLETVTIPPTFLIENTPKTIRNNLNKETKEKKAKKLKCMNCKTSLKEKSQTAKFCGLKCKNHFNGKRRTKRNQSKRLTELRELKKIIPKLKETNLSLLVIYKADGMQYADHLKQSEILTAPEWQKQIKKVLITNDKTAPPLAFTTIRAKQLIKAITEININQKPISKNGN